MTRYGEYCWASDLEPTTADAEQFTIDDDKNPMLFFFETCRHLIRTLPMMQHDAYNPEDLDSAAEDHAVDELRYSCMSRPFGSRITKTEDKNPYLIANVFKLGELR